MLLFSHDEPSRGIDFHDTDGSLFGDQQNVLHDEWEVRSVNISAPRGRKCRRCNVKGKISRGFLRLIKAVETVTGQILRFCLACAFPLS